MKFSGEKVVEIYEKIQQKRPIIHCITNAVTVNDCANILLAAGASPTMAHHPCVYFLKRTYYNLCFAVIIQFSRYPAAALL